MRLTPSQGHTATVFGATGFLGRYIVNRLGTVYSAYVRSIGADMRVV